MKNSKTAHTFEERLEVMTYVASRAYRAARREAEELEDVEVGVTCFTCHL